LTIFPRNGKISEKEGFVMAFFEEIGKTLAGKSKEAAQKAKDVAEVLQLKTQISSEKGKVKELYAAIGAVYFKKNRENEEDEYKMFFPEIEKALAHIGELETKVRELEGAHVCASCGAPLRKGDAFCCKCGAAVEAEKADGEGSEVTDITVDGETVEETAEETVAEAVEETAEETANETAEEAEEDFFEVDDLFVDEDMTEEK